jgi:hypothetical protein
MELVADIWRLSDMDLAKHITFFYTDGTERQTCEPILKEAQRRGFVTEMTQDIKQRAEIGLYCQHQCYPENARFSVIMLHDMAQGHNRWPDFWRAEPWGKFDLGILPGPSWHERWRSCSSRPYAVPRHGIFTCGWPKADLIFDDGAPFQAYVSELRRGLNLKHKRSVLYAPSWENDRKQDDVVRALKDLPLNVLLKQAPYRSSSKSSWVAHHPEVVKAIEEMNQLHRGCAPNVHIIDPELSIMYCLGLADVLVTDESSVMVEALLLNVPSIAVLDWLIPDTSPPRFPSVPFDFTMKTSRQGLRSSVENVLANLEMWRQEILPGFREFHFANLGRASTSIVDVLESSVGPRDVLCRGLEVPGLIETVARLAQEGMYPEALANYKKQRPRFGDHPDLVRLDGLMRLLESKILRASRSSFL